MKKKRLELSVPTPGKQTKHITTARIFTAVNAFNLQRARGIDPPSGSIYVWMGICTQWERLYTDLVHFREAMAKSHRLGNVEF